jgi:hypothetical protein
LVPVPPPPPPTFDLAVRAHSKDTPLITNGFVTLELPGLPKESIGPNGEANFKGLSTEYQAKPIRVLPQVDGYEEKWLQPTVEGNVLTVELETAKPTFVQKAELVPPPPKGKNIKIRVDGQKIAADVDDLGGFTFTANGRVSDRVAVDVFVDGKLAASDYYVLSTHPIDIQWLKLGHKAKQ